LLGLFSAVPLIFAAEHEHNGSDGLFISEYGELLFALMSAKFDSF